MENISHGDNMFRHFARAGFSKTLFYRGFFFLAETLLKSFSLLILIVRSDWQACKMQKHGKSKINYLPDSISHENTVTLYNIYVSDSWP